MIHTEDIYGVPEHLFELLATLDPPLEIDEPHLEEEKDIDLAQFKYDMLSIKDSTSYDDIMSMLMLYSQKLLQLERQKRARVISMLRDFLKQRFSYDIQCDDTILEMNWFDFVNFLKFLSYDNETFFVSLRDWLDANEDMTKQFIVQNWSRIDYYFSSYSSQNKFIDSFLKTCPYSALLDWVTYFLSYSS